MEFSVIHYKAKCELSDSASLRWQDRWGSNENRRVWYTIFPPVGIRRLKDDFYGKHILMGHAIFGVHKFLSNSKELHTISEIGESAFNSCLFVFPIGQSVREMYFYRSYKVRTLRNLCLYGYSKRGWKFLIMIFFCGCLCNVRLFRMFV